MNIAPPGRVPPQRRQSRAIVKNLAAPVLGAAGSGYSLAHRALPPLSCHETKSSPTPLSSLSTDDALATTPPTPARPDLPSVPKSCPVASQPIPTPLIKPRDPLLPCHQGLPAPHRHESRRPSVRPPHCPPELPRRLDLCWSSLLVAGTLVTPWPLSAFPLAPCQAAQRTGHFWSSPPVEGMRGGGALCCHDHDHCIERDLKAGRFLFYRQGGGAFICQPQN